MVKVKSQSAIDKRYRASIGQAAGSYKDGVQATNNWQENAIAAESLYAQKVQEAIAAQRRAKAISAVSNEEWKQAASTKGAQRIAAGMEAGADKRSRNFEPYRQTLEGLQLPERTADPMTNVQNRVGGVVEALVAKKREIKG